MNRLTLEEKKRANKIRCKLLYKIDNDLRKSRNNHHKDFLINSMTLKEVENKFLLFPNYKMKLSTTFTKIAKKYMVMETVDNRSKQNFFYTDYSQDLKKVNHPIVKLQRKRISANNVIKIKYLVDNQEAQSPLPEIFTNKMNIGLKKLKIPDNKYFDINIPFSLNETDNNNNENSNNINNTEIKYKRKKTKKKKDDDSINSLTYDLIEKKANLLSVSLNAKSKKELKRRKKQLEAIKKLRQFCFQNLRNKRNCITKSSHQNLLYINAKFEEEEDEKNNTSHSSKKIKSSNKNKNNNIVNTKYIKNNSRKRNDSINDSKRKKNVSKKKKEKKKPEIYNSLARKMMKQKTAKKSPIKVKRFLFERRSLVEKNNVITGKLDVDLFLIKKRKKEKEKEKEKNEVNSNEGVEEDMLTKITNIKIHKKKTGILRESFKERKLAALFKGQKTKNKANIVAFNNINTNTIRKRKSLESNILRRRCKVKKNLYSSKSLTKVIKKLKRKTSECKSAKNRRYSTPNRNCKIKIKRDDFSQKSLPKSNYKKNNNNDLVKSWFKNDKQEITNFKLKEKKTVNYNEKLKKNKVMLKVEEEDY